MHHTDLTCNLCENGRVAILKPLVASSICSAATQKGETKKIFAQEKLSVFMGFSTTSNEI